MSTRRVVYYPSNDLLYGFGLEKIELLKEDDECNNINDAIEFYEINKYMDENARSKSWSDDKCDEYKRIALALSKKAMRFFNGLSDLTILNEIDRLPVEYRSVFWEVFDKFKIYKRIGESTFWVIINSKDVSSFELFKYPDIVKEYGNCLRQYILQNGACIRAIFSAYDRELYGTGDCYLPREITDDDIILCIENYINSERPNPNLLERIIYMQETKRFPVTAKIRLHAQNRYDSLIVDLVQNDGHSMTFIVEVLFSYGMKDIEEYEEINNNKFRYSYSLDWLTDTLDYPSILNNFIHLFHLVDQEMRCSLVSKRSEASVFERLFSSDSNQYFESLNFHLINNLALNQMSKYYAFLESKGIRLEDVLEWFYTEYLQDEFGCAEMRVSFPSRSIDNYGERCQIICNTMESIIKQYTLYVQEGTIDFELLRMTSGSIKLADIPSLVGGKYVYGNGQDFERITFVLFSDQCLLSYIPRLCDECEKYSCFYDLIDNESIFITDYDENMRSQVKYLEEKELISVINGVITIVDKGKVLFLKDLDKNGVVNRRHFSKSFNGAIENWISEGLLKEESTLLSIPESQYLNYLLNKAEFTNSLDLRNKYSHGVLSTVGDEKEHWSNYNRFLIIMVLLAIKINDEFCLLNKVC